MRAQENEIPHTDRRFPMSVTRDSFFPVFLIELLFRRVALSEHYLFSLPFSSLPTRFGDDFFNLTSALRDHCCKALKNAEATLLSESEFCEELISLGLRCASRSFRLLQ